ncbi:MAG: dockerin type I domain-containing protein [Candidatus Daviesbacteria bacterium]|nr:dockerin type I domain-containing protein [Candidatus Daviesbacteria bacterium]
MKKIFLQILIVLPMLLAVILIKPSQVDAWYGCSDQTQRKITACGADPNHPNEEAYEYTCTACNSLDSGACGAQCPVNGGAPIGTCTWGGWQPCNNSGTGPTGTISCVNNPTCTVTQFNNGVGSVDLDIKWQNWKECQDVGVLPPGETLCYYVGAELCVLSEDGVEKIVRSGGSIPGRPSIFPNGGYDNPEFTNIPWIQPGKSIKFSLYETGYTCDSFANCRENGEYKRRQCRGKLIATQTVTGVSAGPTSTPVPTTSTAFYRVSTAPFGTSNNPEWKAYSDNAGMTADVDFGDVAMGTKLTVYAQFKSTTGEIKSFSKEIEYIGTDPVTSSIECSYSPTGEGTEVKILGENFGDQGSKSKVTFNSQTAQIISWGNQMNPTYTPVPTNPTIAEPTSTASASVIVLGISSKSTVLAKISDKLKENLAIPVFLETNSGRRAPKTGQLYCTINVTTVNFVALTACRPPANFGGETRVQIYENTANAKPIFDKKVLVGNDGTMGWAPSSALPIVEVGKKYVLIIKGPKGIAIKKEFTAQTGSTILSDIALPVGDIAPIANPDNTVNSLDYSELKREWNAVTDVTRAGDFNMDNRINSFDYSCMRNSFNITGAQFLTGQ